MRHARSTARSLGRTSVASEYRQRIQESLENDLDSLQYTYNQHFTVANWNRRFGQIIDAAIFLISGLLVIREVTAGLERDLLIVSLVITAGLSALHRAMKPGEHETEFRESAHAHHDLFKRGRKLHQLDLPSEELTDDEVRSRYDEFYQEYLDLNQSSPDASPFWYRYMKRMKGEERMAEEITTTDEMREALRSKN